MSGLGAEAFGVNPVSTDCSFSGRVVVWGFLLREEQVPPPVREELVALTARLPTPWMLAHP